MDLASGGECVEKRLYGDPRSRGRLGLTQPPSCQLLFICKGEGESQGKEEGKEEGMAEWREGRDGQGERPLFQPLVHFPKICSSLGWIRLKPAVLD